MVLRPHSFISLQLILLLLMLITLATSYIGLGANENFILYRVFGIKRHEAWQGLCLLIFCSWAYQVLAFAVTRGTRFSQGKPLPIAVASSAWRGAKAATRPVFAPIPFGGTRREYWGALVLAVFFLATFRLLSTRALGEISGQTDQHYHQAFVDYDIDWGTPVFSLAGNLLNNFGVQVPFNGNAAPILGLAHIIARAHEFEIVHTAFFLLTAALLWVLGTTFGLRPLARVTVTGTAALIATIPVGLDRVVYLVPPHLLTHLPILGLWWYEASLYCLTASVFFFLLGQRKSVSANLSIALGFAVASSLLLLAFPAGAAFGAIVIGLYCLAFFISSQSKAELYWKTGTGALLGVAYLVAKLPSFFVDLYSYTFSSLYHQSVALDIRDYMGRFGFIQDLLNSTMPGSLGRYDARLIFVWTASFATACLIGLMSSGPALRRFAFAVIFLEIGIVILSIINSVRFQEGISFNYSEMFHVPFLLWFFAIFCVVVLLILDRVITLYLCNGAAGSTIGSWFSLLARYRLGLYLVIAGLAMSPYLIEKHPVQYAFFPARGPFSPLPPSVALLKNELGLKPGAPFKGRMMALGGTRAEPGDQWPGTQPGTTFDVLMVQYQQLFGNNHFIDLLGLGIPDATEYGHWTSPITFTLLRAFFSNPKDAVLKAYFPLRVFNARIARLMGVRMIVTDAEQLRDAQLVYEAKAGDAVLRIFQLEGVNLGQYSPVHGRVAGTAAEAVSILSEGSFDPKRDVVTEEDLRTRLVPASEAAVVTDLGPTLSVRAVSSGTSLLVLPFEYSACLRLKLNQSGSAELLPVNLQQTGLLFEGGIDASIAYRFGPFDEPRCRRRDIERAERLRLRDLAEKANE